MNTPALGPPAACATECAVALGQRVECRDDGEEWEAGVVTSQYPLEVKQDEYEKGYGWDEVRAVANDADDADDTDADDGEESKAGAHVASLGIAAVTVAKTSAGKIKKRLFTGRDRER